MKKYIFFLILIVQTSLCLAENNNSDIFEGIWCIDAQEKFINDFLIIMRIEDQYLVITAYTDDDSSQKSFAKKTSDKTLEVEFRGNLYTIKWDKDGDEEWLEMYINPNAEDYPYYERVENFPIDKFF